VIVLEGERKKLSNLRVGISLSPGQTQEKGGLLKQLTSQKNMIEFGDGRKIGPGGLLFFLEANMQVPQSSVSLRGPSGGWAEMGGALNQSAEGLRGK
jgi:hypothetical protein